MVLKVYLTYHASLIKINIFINFFCVTLLEFLRIIILNHSNYLYQQLYTLNSKNNYTSPNTICSV